MYFVWSGGLGLEFTRLEIPSGRQKQREALRSLPVHPWNI